MDGMQYAGGGLAFLIYVIFKLVEENGIWGTGSILFTVLKYLMKVYCYVFSFISLIFLIMFSLHHLGFPKKWGTALYIISIAIGSYIAIKIEGYFDTRKQKNAN